MTAPAIRFALTVLPLTLVLCACNTTDTRTQLHPADQTQAAEEEKAMLVQYLEIVTPDVDVTCSVLAKMHGVSFGQPDAGRGNARTAALKDGGRIGVRAPMAEHEDPTVRPYMLVDDIEIAVSAAQAAGGQIAMPPTEIPGGGKFAIYILGGIQHGLWQL